MFAHLLKYDPNQARVPAGESSGGQWSADGGGAAKAKPSGGWKTHDLYSRLSAKDGGFSYQPVTGTEPTTGYVLSTYPQFSEAKPAKDLKLCDLVTFVAKHQDLFQKENHLFGAWHDPETDKVYFDISTVTQDKSEAEALAKKHDQIAYFDLGTKKSVTVNRAATSGGAAVKGDNDGTETGNAARPSWFEGFLTHRIGRPVQKADGPGADGAGDQGRANDAGFSEILKYSPDQPRADAGSPEGGQWTAGDGGGGSGSGKAGLSGTVSHDVVSKNIVKAIELRAAHGDGVKTRAGAGDLVDHIDKAHHDELVRMIDELPADKRPTILLHKGDKAKGIPTLWLLGWSKGEGTDIHDHAGSVVGVRVIRGEVNEKVYGLPYDFHRTAASDKNGVEALVHERNLRAGSTMTIPDPYIHEMFGSSNIKTRDITLHAYYPPLEKMTYYTHKDGKLFYDGMWEEGHTPAAGEKTRKCCACSELEHVFKYNPEQPRALAGTPNGGQWTAGDTPATDLAKATFKDRSAEDVLAAHLNPSERALYDAHRRMGEGPTSAEQNSKNGRYTKERLAVHREILNEVFRDVQRFKPEVGKPELVVLAGRGGSGKSSFGTIGNGVPGIAAYDSSRFFRIDADGFKDALAQKDRRDTAGGVGPLAVHYHDESSRLFDRAVVMARNMGLNTVLDVTMNSPHLNRLAAFKKAGYDTSAYLMFLPPQHAADRAMSRYKENNQTGRLVPPEYVLNSRNNEKNFDRVKRRVNRWSIYTSDVPRGEPPRHISGQNVALRRALTGKEEAGGFGNVFKPVQSVRRAFKGFLGLLTTNG